MGTVWLKNALVINEGKSEKLDILIKGDKIVDIKPSGNPHREDGFEIGRAHV